MDILGGNGLPADILKIFVLVATASVAVLSAAFVQAATDTVEVNVSVEQVSEITVTPVSLNFSLFPGTFATFAKLDVQNTGSLNVTNLHVFTDTLTDEAVRPYGATNSTYYAAGGVLAIRNETLSTVYFAGRLEWNETEDISNMIKTGVTVPASWGFYRNTSLEYNWLVGNDTAPAGACNTTGVQFAIEDDVDNGTAASRTPTTTGITQNGVDANFVYFSINRVTSPLNTACVAVAATDCRIYIYKYDRRSGFNTCANSAFLQGPPLQPGQTHTVNISAYLPLGIPASPGQLNTSTITFSAS